jgi:hypothetical protein
MKKILVENVKDGMVLAREVCGASGSALLNKGTVLTVTMGRRLKNWGVPYVCIDGEEDHAEEKPNVDVSPEEVHQILSAKFADVIENPVMKELFTAVYSFKSRQVNV